MPPNSCSGCFAASSRNASCPVWKNSASSHLPPAVAAAQYHYLSNWIGGVSVEYMYETDRKAWIRYPPPRWIWRGTAICGVPGEVSRAMLRGWHANNGVSLGNPNLGFVCTKQSVDGQDGLEGYYCEYDHALEIDQRLMFARHLEAPLFDAASAPALPVKSWPKPRLEKAYRNYAMEYVRTAAPVMVQLFGPEDAGYLLHLTGKLIGMQYFDEIARGFAARRGAAKEFAAFLCALFEAQDDVVGIEESGGTFEIRQQTWKLMADVADYHPACARVLEGLFAGPRGRLRAPHRRHHETGGRRWPAIRLVDRLIHRAGVAGGGLIAQAAHAPGAHGIRFDRC